MCFATKSKKPEEETGTRKAADILVSRISSLPARQGFRSTVLGSRPRANPAGAKTLLGT